MKKIFHLPFFLVAILVSTLSYSQTSFREGFVVNNSGDTIKGWIDYRQWEQNPNAIKFKNDLTIDKFTTYTLNDISNFEITGFDKYIKAVVNKDMRPLGINQEENLQDTTENDTVFLRVLVEGKISLYQFVEKTKPHFYIKEAEKDYQELTYKEYMQKQVLVKENIFRDQLRQFFPNSHDLDALPPLLRSADYKEKDLTRLVEKINASTGNGSITYKVTQVKQPVSFYAGTGMVYSTLSFSGQKGLNPDLDYSNSFQPLLAGGVDFNIGRNHQRVVLRFELIWYNLKYEGTRLSNTGDSLSYKLKLNNLAPSFSVLYNILNYPKNKLYVGAGAIYNFSSYPENDFRRKYSGTTQIQNISPYLDMEKSWLSINGKLGYLINKKIDIVATAKLGGQFSNFIGFSLKPSLYFLNVNYHF